VKDVTGQPIAVGDRVGVAFSYSRASVGYIRVGKVISLDPFRMRWEDNKNVNPESPPLAYSETRVVRL